MDSKKHIIIDDVKTHDPEQIARDHTNLMIEDYENGVLDAYISDIELTRDNIMIREEKKFL